MSDNCRCSYCNAEIDKKTAYHISRSRSYFCNETCYLNNEQDKKSPPKEKKNPKPINGSSLRHLTDYIQSLLIDNGMDKDRINWEMIIKQAKNIIANQEGNCNYETIRYTLQYMIDVAKINVFDYKEGSVLNLVPYNIRDARAYYFEMQEVRQSAQSVQLDDTPFVIKISDVSNKSKFKKINF